MTVSVLPALSGGAAAGLVLFSSWIGYGHGVMRMMGPSDGQDLPWGWLAATGLAATVFLGGWLSLTGLVSPWSNAAVAAIGLMLFLDFLRQRRPFRHIAQPLGPRAATGKGERSWLAIGQVVRALVLGLLVLHLLGSQVPFWVDECDDFPAYFQFPRQLLETGTLIEPFNLRRLGGLGGGVFLQSMLYPILGLGALPFLDSGLGRLLLVGAAYGFWASGKAGCSARSRAAGDLCALGVLLAASALTLYNHAPLVLPHALFLCLFAMAYRCSERGSHSRREWLTLVGVAATIVTLRNNYVAVSALFVLGVAGWRLHSPRPAVARVLLAGVTGFVLLLPWMLLSYASSRTPFFPLIKGNFMFPAGFGEALAPQATASFVGEVLVTSRVGTLLLLALVAWAVGRCRDVSCASAIATAAAVLLTALAMTGSDTYSLSRYSQPYLFAAILAVSGYVIRAVVAGEPAPGGQLRRSLCGALVALVLSVWALWPSQVHFYGRPIQTSVRQTAWQQLSDFARSTRHITSARLSGVRNPVHPAYLKVQERLPAGARVLSAVAAPFFWDFGRQQIQTLDCPGQVSPPPGMPFFAGPQAVVDYLRGLGYRYLAYTPPWTRNCLYDERRWRSLAAGDSPLFAQWAPYFLDFFENVRKLERQGLLILDFGAVRVLDLDRGRAVWLDGATG
jgi:hypothetical protein